MFKAHSKSNSLLSLFLSELGVKHTSNYADKLFNEHPHKYNLFGLSKTLDDYKIANAGIRIEDKENDINNLDPPFIAHASDDFMIVKGIKKDKIEYFWRGKDESISRKEFSDMWSGVILYAEPDAESIEPNYKKNRVKELFAILQQYALFAGIAVLFVLAFIYNGLYANLGLTLSLIVNIVGLYTGFLLVQKQMNIQSDYADKICSLFKQSDCNNILESDAAKLWGLIGWSELGLSYFISNVIVILMFPNLYPYLVLINIFALPYSFWSVWYQKFKAKEWCPLCLLVQLIFWSIFIVNLIFGFIVVPDFSISSILLLGCLYGIPFLVINLSLPKLAEGNKVERIIQEINSIKAQDEVFSAILKQQTKYEVNLDTSVIRWGNPNASTLVTILTNPHCGPCSRMHKRVNTLMEANGENICLQYIFSSFSEDLNSSSKYLMAEYFANSSEEERNKIYNHWFDDGKYQKDEVIEKSGLNLNSEEVLAEFEKHNEWAKETGLRATPTILINGYALPDNYKIEDLHYVSKLDL